MESFNIIYFGSNTFKKFKQTLNFNVQNQTLQKSPLEFFIKESFNIIYFGSKTNSKTSISLDTYTTQNLKQLL